MQGLFSDQSRYMELRGAVVEYLVREVLFLYFGVAFGCARVFFVLAAVIFRTFEPGVLYFLIFSSM